MQELLFFLVFIVLIVAPIAVLWLLGVVIYLVIMKLVRKRDIDSELECKEYEQKKERAWRSIILNIPWR